MRDKAEACDRIGTLRDGALADIAIFNLEDGRFKFEDAMGKTRYGGKTSHSPHAP